MRRPLDDWALIILSRPGVTSVAPVTNHHRVSNVMRLQGQQLRGVQTGAWDRGPGATIRAPMRQPLVSVVIPCYNAERYVVATCKSVLAQDVDLEVIVVDDGSNDASVEAVLATGLPIRLLQQSNQGVSAARNAGVAAARGEWVAFVDADDIWLPGKLAAQVSLLSSEPGARMAYTAWHVWFSDDPAPRQELIDELLSEGKDSRWSGPSGDIYPELLEDCVVWTSTVLMQRSLFEQAGGFDTSRHVGEDYDLWLRCSRLTPILRVSAPMALYRMHFGSVTHRVQSRNFKGEVIDRALAQWGYTSAAGRQANRVRVDAGLARSWADHAGNLLKQGDARGARTAALRSLRCKSNLLLAWKVLLRALVRRAGATSGLQAGQGGPV